MTKTQRSVKTVLHTSETKIEYGKKKMTRLDMNLMQGAKSIYRRCTCALGCRLTINLCKIMRDSKSRAITQTIHTNLVGLFCDAGYVVLGKFFCVARYLARLREPWHSLRIFHARRRPPCWYTGVAQDDNIWGKGSIHLFILNSLTSMRNIN